MIPSHADLRECYLGLVSLKLSLLLGGPWSNESNNGLFPSSCRDSLAHLVLVRVLTCLLLTKKFRNVAGKCLYIN